MHSLGWKNVQKIKIKRNHITLKNIQTLDVKMERGKKKLKNSARLLVFSIFCGYFFIFFRSFILFRNCCCFLFSFDFHYFFSPYFLMLCIYSLLVYHFVGRLHYFVSPFGDRSCCLSTSDGSIARKLSFANKWWTRPNLTSCSCRC